MRDDLIEIEIGAIGKIRNGYSFKSKDYVDQGLRIIRIANVQSGEIIDRDPKFYPESKISEFKDYLIEEDDFLISLTGNVGRVGRIDKSLLPALLNQRVGKLELRTKRIEKNYLYHFLTSRSFVNKVIQSSKGVAQLNTSSKKIEAIKIPVLPLPEQRAIVAKIEELFSSLDQGIAELKKAQEQLKVYRQAVLKKAFEGLNEFKPLKECGEWKGGGTPSRRESKYWDNGKIPWVSSRDVKTKEIHDTERHITELAIPNSSTKWIEKESLLFVMRSGILRRIFPIAIAKTKLCVNQDLQTVFLNSKWYPEYVYWFLKCNETNIRHTCSKDGTTVESIDANSLKAYLIPICTLKEQHKIVKEIESRLSVCDDVEKSIEVSLEKANSLRQSILKKAFEGTLLTEEEIAECKSEPDYEPANVLLEKIKKEKEKKYNENRKTQKS